MSYKPKNIIENLERRLAEKDLEIARLKGEAAAYKACHEKVINNWNSLTHDGFRIAYKGKF